jgi:hypothetical protein
VYHYSLYLTGSHLYDQVEYKTKWAAPLEDLVVYFRRNDPHNALEQQSIEAVHQLYGYMTLNENKYGVLSNMQHAWFFQRVETAGCKGKTLQYYGPIDLDIDSVHSPSMLKAFVGIILLAETTPTWSYPPPDPTTINAAITEAQFYNSTPLSGSYPVLPLDPRLCHFDYTSVRHVSGRGSTARAALVRKSFTGGSLDVFCKIVDLFQSSDAINALNTETCNYATLQHLQGSVIPQVYGYYKVWGLLKLLALEDVGTEIPENAPIDIQTREMMKSALARIHATGYVHGDITRRNFCQRDNLVFLVDLESLAVGSSAEMEAELAAVDAL